MFIEDIDKTPLLLSNSVATWSSDGEFIAFTAGLGEWRESSDAVYILNLETREVERITPFDDGGFRGVDWSQ
jgi:Tol biopolymer transport system component